jgi:hypothetical protein
MLLAAVGTFIAYRVLKALRRIIRLLYRILKVLEQQATTPTAASVEIYVNHGGILERATNVIQKVTEAKTYVVVAKDAKGNVAQIQSPVWALSDPALGELVAAADGLSCVFTPAGPLGEVKIQLAADADLGEGVSPINGEGAITLTAGDAVTLEIAQA